MDQFASIFGKKDHVSCEELDLLVDTAKEIDGVMGACMMGGGFGGCTINLIQSSAVETFKKKTTEAFTKAFGKPPVFYDGKELMILPKRLEDQPHPEFIEWHNNNIYNV